jgi:hypothetical protein
MPARALLQIDLRQRRRVRTLRALKGEATAQRELAARGLHRSERAVHRRPSAPPPATRTTATAARHRHGTAAGWPARLGGSPRAQPCSRAAASHSKLERRIEVPMCVAGEEHAVALAPREVHGVEHRPFGAPQQHRACPCDRPEQSPPLGTPCDALRTTHPPRRAPRGRPGAGSPTLPSGSRTR